MKNGNKIEVLVYPTSDAEKSKKLLNAYLGVEPYVDGDYYIGYKTDGMEIGLDPNASGGPISYVDTDDIEGTLQTLVEAGAEIVQEPVDVANGLLVARLKDADGNLFGVRQPPE